MDPFKPKNEDLKEIQNKLHQLHKTADAYLDTDVTDLELSLDIETKEVIRGEVGDFKNQCFLLHHVLSRTQCQQLIARGEEMGFGQIEGVKESVRNMKRYVISYSLKKDFSNPFATELWPEASHWSRCYGRESNTCWNLLQLMEIPTSIISMATSNCCKACGRLHI